MKKFSELLEKGNAMISGIDMNRNTLSFTFYNNQTNSIPEELKNEMKNV